jgi:hypothetical protein
MYLFEKIKLIWVIPGGFSGRIVSATSLVFPLSIARGSPLWSRKHMTSGRNG